MFSDSNPVPGRQYVYNSLAAVGRKSGTEKHLLFCSALDCRVHRGTEDNGHARILVWVLHLAWLSHVQERDNSTNRLYNYTFGSLFWRRPVMSYSSVQGWWPRFGARSKVKPCIECSLSTCPSLGNFNYRQWTKINLNSSSLLSSAGGQRINIKINS